MNYGFYHVSWAAPGAPDAKRHRQLTDLVSTAESGCTLMHLSHLGDSDFTLTLLNLAASRGLTLIVEDVPDDQLPDLQGHPAFIHNTCDDAQDKLLPEVTSACMASTLARRYLSVAPSSNEPHPELYGLSECVGVQSYVYNGAETLLGSWEVWQEARRQANQANVQVIANSQLARIGATRPTPEQIRAQVWCAAAAGLDGILGYCLLDNNGPLPTVLRQAFVRACWEVNSLTSGTPLSVAEFGPHLSVKWAGGASITLDLQGSVVTALTRR